MTDNQNIAMHKIMGQSFNYKDEDLYFERYKEISGGRVAIFTHKYTFHITVDEIDEFLDSLEQPKAKDFREKSLVAQNTKALAGYTPSAENVELKASLMEMLAKVKGNPNAIPQAKSVCDIAKTMIDMQKVELEAIKMLTGK